MSRREIKRRKENRVTKATRKAPTCPGPPKELSQASKSIWKQLAPIAWNLGTLTDADIQSFSLFCRTLETEASAAEHIDEHV